MIANDNDLAGQVHGLAHAAQAIAEQIGQRLPALFLGDEAGQVQVGIAAAKEPPYEFKKI